MYAEKKLLKSILWELIIFKWSVVLCYSNNKFAAFFPEEGIDHLRPKGTYSLSMVSFIDQIILQWFAFKKESISNLMNLLFNANLNKYSNFTEYLCLFFFFFVIDLFTFPSLEVLIPWAGQKHPWSEVMSLSWASFEGFLKACSPSCVQSGWWSLDIFLFKPYKDII